jgi:quercetin 2,3-dioxygenase
MVVVRRAGERFHSDLGWLDSWHSFSFGEHYHPAHMGFRALRVINEDRVRPGAGFPSHPHQDMEIISVVLSGALEHRDSLGTGSVIRPGEVQRMSAGTGVRHSEYNASQTEPVHFLQIWIVPRELRLPPSYEQRSFEPGGAPAPRLIASEDGREGSVRVHQDVSVWRCELSAGPVSLPVGEGRHAWVQVIADEIEVEDEVLTAGDGVALSGVVEVNLRGAGQALVFDLA